MKVTLELPDELLEQARNVARREGTTLGELVDEGLQRCIRARRRTVRRWLDFPSCGGSGLTPEFRGASWEAIRDEVYADSGGACHRR